MNGVGSEEGRKGKEGGRESRRAAARFLTYFHGILKLQFLPQAFFFETPKYTALQLRIHKIALQRPRSKAMAAAPHPEGHPSQGLLTVGHRGDSEDQTGP